MASAGQALGPLVEQSSARPAKGAAGSRWRRSNGWRAQNGRVAAGRRRAPVAGARRARLRRRSSRSRARPTAGSRWTASARWRADAASTGRPGRPRVGRSDHLRGRAGAAADGDHLAGVVGDRGARAGATRPSRSTSSATSPGTRCPGASTSTSITQWMLELGEGLPAYRPPLDHRRQFGDQGAWRGRLEVTLRYLTPHSKWSIHSEYQDNLHMLTLFRGGPVIWDERRRTPQAIGVAGQRLGRGVQPQRRRRVPGGGLASAARRARA